MACMRVGDASNVIGPLLKSAGRLLPLAAATVT
jgi:hypothetical protein